MTDSDDWSTNASEAVQISFLKPGESSPQILSSFQPQWTYSIFGDDEIIAGYQGLKINLSFAAHDLRPHLAVHYERKFKASGESQPTDVEECLRPYLATEAFDKTASFNAHLQGDAAAPDFKPPGELVDAYSSKGREFEIWSAELSDPRAKLLVRRIQILISFLIEGGTPLDLDEEDWSLARWRVYFVYEKIKASVPGSSSYSFVGYSTSYRFIIYSPNAKKDVSPRSFTLPPATPLHSSDLPSRIRISQFLILPTHHSHGHGSHLYDAMVGSMLKSSTCTEITVEDPSEAFDDLRDYRDYARLRQLGVLSRIHLNADIDSKLTANRIGVRVPTSRLLDTALLESLRREHKIAPRQFYRLVEMYLFHQIPSHTRSTGTNRLVQRARATNKDDRTYYYWRMLVKQRVYKQNKDMLIQVDKAERIDKVEQAVGDIAGDYERLLRGMGKWQDEEKKSLNVNGDGEESSIPRRDRPKRKILDDEDEELASETPKRARSEAL